VDWRVFAGILPHILLAAAANMIDFAPT